MKRIITMKYSRRQLVATATVLLFFPVYACAYADGYHNTGLWWDSVKKQAAQYSDYLKDIYLQEEHKITGAGRVEAEFCYSLKLRHPGSKCSVEELSGTVQLTSETSFTFNRDLQVRSITRQDQDTTYRYYFNQNSSDDIDYEVIQGRGRISLVFDPEDYRESSFGPSTVLSEVRVGAKAEEVTDILEDVYRGHYGKTSMQMDEFAQKAILDREFRAQILSEDFVDGIRSRRRSSLLIKGFIAMMTLAFLIVSIMIFFEVGPIRWERKRKDEHGHEGEEPVNEPG